MAQCIIIHYENSVGIVPGGDARGCATHYPGPDVCEYDEGSITIWLMTGNYSVRATVYHYGYVTRYQTVNITIDEWENVYFHLSNNHELHGSIEGYVQDTNGDPIGGCMVWAESCDGTYNRFGCKTLSNGFYCLPVFMAGEYMIYAGSNGWEKRLYDVTTYTQAAHIPVATTTINFTGAYALARGDYDDEDGSLFVEDRAKYAPDLFGMDIVIESMGGEPKTDNVYAKARTFSGIRLRTYLSDDNEEATDGTGGSDYGGGF